MRQKNLVKVCLFLSIVVVGIYSSTILPSYLREAKMVKDREAIKKEETKRMNVALNIQTSRVDRIIAWTKVRNLPHTERQRLLSTELKAGYREFMETSISRFSTPINPKALVER